MPGVSLSGTTTAAVIVLAGVVARSEAGWVAGVDMHNETWRYKFGTKRIKLDEEFNSAVRIRYGWADWVVRKDKAYFHDQGMGRLNYEEAVEFCGQMAATNVSLPSVHSAEQMSFLVQLSENNRHGFWLGCSRSDDTVRTKSPNYGFAWTDGSDFDYESWDQDEPSSSRASNLMWNEACAISSKNNQNPTLWADSSCYIRRRVICVTDYIEPTCNGVAEPRGCVRYMRGLDVLKNSVNYTRDGELITDICDAVPFNLPRTTVGAHCSLSCDTCVVPTTTSAAITTGPTTTSTVTTGTTTTAELTTVAPTTTTAAPVTTTTSEAPTTSTEGPTTTTEARTTTTGGPTTTTLAPSTTEGPSTQHPTTSTEAPYRPDYGVCGTKGWRTMSGAEMFGKNGIDRDEWPYNDPDYFCCYKHFSKKRGVNSKGKKKKMPWEAAESECVKHGIFTSGLDGATGSLANVYTSHINSFLVDILHDAYYPSEPPVEGSWIGGKVVPDTHDPNASEEYKKNLVANDHRHHAVHGLDALTRNGQMPAHMINWFRPYPAVTPADPIFYNGSVQYQNWLPFEPSHYSSGTGVQEDCVAMGQKGNPDYPSVDGRWNDASCEKKMSYFCEICAPLPKRPTTPPTTTTLDPNATTAVPTTTTAGPTTTTSAPPTTTSVAPTTTTDGPTTTTGPSTAIPTTTSTGIAASTTTAEPSTEVTTTTTPAPPKECQDIKCADECDPPNDQDVHEEEPECGWSSINNECLPYSTGALTHLRELGAGDCSHTIFHQPADDVVLRYHCAQLDSDVECTRLRTNSKCTWDRQQSMCKFKPLVVKTKLDPLPSYPCGKITCGAKCTRALTDDRCGWSTKFNVCKEGARTRLDEMTKGECDSIDE